MKFNIGDKVKFLHEKGSGVVKRFINQNMVMVEDEDGFETPVYADKLVKIEGGFSKEPETVKQEQHQKTSYHEQEIRVKDIDLNEKIILGIIPNTAMDSRLAILNNSSYNALCLMGIAKDHRIENIINCELEPGAFVNTKIFNHEQLQRSVSLSLQVLYYKEEAYAKKSPMDFSIAMNDLMHLKIAKNAYFVNESGIVELSPEDHFYSKEASYTPEAIADLLKEKGDFKVKMPAKPLNNTPEMVEIDLHIEALIDNHKSLSNSEIVKIQLNTFEKELNKAIIEKIKKIVFIHGVGNGTLKFELRRMLDNKYSDHKYHDASFAEYGFGATMVIV